MAKILYFLIDQFLKLSRKLFRGKRIQLFPVVTQTYKILMKFRTSSQGESFKLNFRNSTFLCQPGDITILPSLMDGTFEKTELDVFERILLEKPSQTIFIDVGANIGVWSVLAGKVLTEGSRVFAFEPDQNNLNRLHKNISINELRNVLVVPKAVGVDGLIPFFISEFGGVSSFTMNSNETAVIVESVRLDTFFQESKFDHKDRVLIKIDVEGYEATVLRNSLELISRKLPILFVEIDFSVIRRNLDDWGSLMPRLFNLYSYSYLVSFGQFSRVTHKDIPTISSLETLCTLIFSPSKLIGAER